VGRDSYWTIVNSGTDGIAAIDGSKMYKAEVVASNGSNPHRAYPVLHIDEIVPGGLQGPFINTFYAWVDVAEDATWPWAHLVTYANTTYWENYGFNLDYAYTPGAPHMIGPVNLDNRVFMNGFDRNPIPKRRWVKYTAYVNPQHNNGQGLMFVWVDGVAAISASGSRMQQTNGTFLRAHWGLYGDGMSTRGVYYQDAIKIYKLNGPLQNLSAISLEPIVE
jgi:hypothetical protein